MSKLLRANQLSAAKLISLIFILFAAGTPSILLAASQVQTTGTGVISKVAPGELLPISVKLANFGNNSRVDVTIVYKVDDLQGREIYSGQETVAVETTANFNKNIQIPAGTVPGQYIASSSIVYKGQVTPATSEFSFTVERKIFGLFQSDFYYYGGIVLLFGAVVGIISRLWISRRRATRQEPIDYSNIPGESKIFYELISDTVMGMRQQVGDKALDIAKHVDGLTIDAGSGRVLSLTEKPSKVIAELVSEYEKALGKKVSFSFRRP